METTAVPIRLTHTHTQEREREHSKKVHLFSPVCVEFGLTRCV